MTVNVNTVTLRCDCACTMLVVDKCHEREVIFYNLSMQDSKYSNINGLTGRIKRAWRALFGRPIYYNDILIENEKDMIKFRDDLTELISR